MDTLKVASDIGKVCSKFVRFKKKKKKVLIKCEFFQKEERNIQNLKSKQDSKGEICEWNPMVETTTNNQRLSPPPFRARLARALQVQSILENYTHLNRTIKNIINNKFKNFGKNLMF